MQGNVELLLTIAIPTYNRLEQLKNTLQKLLPQLTKQCVLKILDNYSTVVIEEEISELLSQYPFVNYIVYRNKINIGGEANVVRCFEYCDTKWLWILSDDDFVADNAVATILEDVEVYNDFSNIVYFTPNSTNTRPTSSMVCTGRKEFLNAIDVFTDSIFLSANIYNLNKFTERTIPIAYLHTYSYCPHWVALFSSLKQDCKTVYSNKTICEYNNFEYTTKHSPLFIQLVFSFSSILESIYDVEEYKIFKTKLKVLSYGTLRVNVVIKALLIEYKIAASKSIKYNIKNKVGKMWWYYYLPCSNNKARLSFFMWYLLIKLSPNKAYAICRKLVITRKKGDINSYVNQGFN